MDESKNNGLEADWIENTKQQEHATQRVAWNAGLAPSEFFALGRCDPDALVPLAQSIQG